MISVLSKPVDQIGVADLQELIDSKVPEGEQVEFKESLPTRDGSPDRWVSGGSGIGDRARNVILEEAVAFANAYGGALVLGVAESNSTPPAAAGICPIPRCNDLAERLKLVFRDCVEPQIPSVEISAIPTDGDNGTVVIRVGKSRMAPHRVKPTRKCPIRRSDRCEEMTMREIQDLTLNLSRGLELLERRLALRSERFVEELNHLKSPEKCYGIRVTAAPVGEGIQFDRVYNEDKLYGTWRSVSLFSGDREIKLGFPLWAMLWQPMLRAARCEYSRQTSGKEFDMYREIHHDGLVEIGLVSCKDYDINEQYQLRIYIDWMMTLFANLIVWADHVRNEASAPTAEYAVEVEVYTRGREVYVAGYGQSMFFTSYRTKNPFFDSVKYPGGLQSSPRYSLGEQSEVTDLIALFERDFWNSIGQNVGDLDRRFVIENWPGCN